MEIRRTLQTVDTHTVGAPTRHVVGGIPAVPGGTMMEKMLYMKEHHDWIRRFVTFEPRGSRVAAATLLTTPCTPGTDVGVLYFEPNGWLPMCGHDTIGMGTLLVETGMIKVEEPYTYAKLDTPAGVVSLKIHVVNGKAVEVSFTNAPAFVALEDGIVRTKEYGDIRFSVSYGGNFYAIIPVSAVDLDICPENYHALIAAGDIIKPYINEQFTVVHPENENIRGVSHIEFTGPAKSPDAHSQNAVVCTPGGIDRSPCGTGTCARSALLFQKGEIKLGEPFIHESIIGSRYSCQVVDTATVGSLPAVIPEVTGKSYIMGMSTLMLDPDDPFAEGFLLG